VNKEAETKGGREQRRYFRIDDEISLGYRKLDPSRSPRGTAFSPDLLENHSLSSSLDLLTEEAKPSLRKLERSNPDAAECCKILETKISLLARMLVRQELRRDGQKERKVNLSAAGVAFACEEEFQPGDLLELKMLLPSTMTVIVTKGKVVHCTENDDPAHPYTVAVDYRDLKKEDREALVKHVVKRQLQQVQDYQ